MKRIVWLLKRRAYSTSGIVDAHSKAALVLFVMFVYSSFIAHEINAQCNISILIDTVESSNTAICIGDSLHIQAKGECVLLTEDFNNMAFGSPQWSFYPGTVLFTNPCAMSSNGTSYVWFGSNTPPSREIVTKDLNVLSGGYISFSLRYGLQAAGQNCDGPDAMREGVSLQYSSDLGDTWYDIAYFAPTGNILPSNPMTTLPSTFGPTNFTVWGDYSFPIPAGAMTTQTRFRWIQYYASYYNGHYDDNWGMDNIIISRSISLDTRWEHGYDTTSPPPVTPLDDSVYIVHLLNYQPPFDTIASDSLFVDVHQLPVFQFVMDTNRICFRDSASIMVTGGHHYAWNTGVHGDSICVSPYGTTVYSVTATDDIGCYYIDSTLLFIESLPAVSTSNDTICAGDTAVLMAYGGAVYQWGEGSTSATLNVTPLYTTSYSVTVTGQNQCSDTSSAMVHVWPLPLGVVDGGTTICRNEVAELSVSGGVVYTWSNGVISNYNPVSPSSDTWYFVTISDDKGCSMEDSILIIVNPLEHVTILVYSDTICRGTSSLLNVSGADYYYWNTGEVSEQIEVWPGNSMTFTVQGSIDYYGRTCSQTADVEIIVEECNTLHFANAFNPEGFSSEFKPVGNFFSIRDYYFAVFDRWGKVIFETDDWNVGWNGKVGDEYAPNAVYAYYIRFIKDYSDEKFEKIGTVTIIK